MKAARQHKEIVSMHERFKSRLKMLEQERAQQTQPSFVILFQAVDRHGQPLEATVATARDSVSRRAAGETLADFEARRQRMSQAFSYWNADDLDL
jgi:hypothetical protein